MKTLREKQDAVLILLEESILLSYEQKLDIIDEFPRLTQEQIDALGSFLAAEEKIREEFPEDIQKGIESVLSQIVGEKIEMPTDDNKVYIGIGKPA